MNLFDIATSFHSSTFLEQTKAIDWLRENLSSYKDSEIRKAIALSGSPMFQKTLKNWLLLERISRPDKEAPKESSLDEEPKKQIFDLDAIKRDSVVEGINLVLHEIEPIIGAISVNASREIDDFENSATSIELSLLDETLQTLDDFMKVENTVRYSKVNISSIISSEICKLEKEKDIQIVSDISESLHFVTDKSMFRIIISNALKNAVQATLALSLSNNQPILINGGVTDKELWISIIDHGVGLEYDQKVLMKSKVTTKPGNKGMGLGIINRAVIALDGNWELKDGNVGGAEFYLELPLGEAL